jgi:RHS repeat-associated protein
VGKENDGTGLMREGYRYYSFDLQRYISEDPIGLAGGDVNFYVRVGNNPVNQIDPLGLISIGDVIIDGALEGFQHGWESGYYGCLAKCMAGSILAPVGAKGAEELSTQMIEHGGAEWIARKYYTFKYPNWFTAGGRYSKVLVPKLAGYMKLGAKTLSVAGWGYFIYEEYKCVKKCIKCL